MLEKNNKFNNNITVSLQIYSLPGSEAVEDKQGLSVHGVC